MALWALGCVSSGQLPVLAHDGLDALCPFLLQERQIELDNLELAVQLDQTRLGVAEEIFVLLDGLWDNDAVERLTYLAGKHHRDTARVSLERARRRVERQQAVVEQYRLVCSTAVEEQLSSEKRRGLEQAYRRYREMDCEVRALDIEVIEINLEHHRENLASILDLLENEVASRHQVILEERDVELMEKQLEQSRQRAARCRQEIAEQCGGQDSRPARCSRNE